MELSISCRLCLFGSDWLNGFGRKLAVGAFWSETRLATFVSRPTMVGHSVTGEIRGLLAFARPSRKREQVGQL